MRVDVPPGVSHAVTEDGVELPVIDVTHPAFAIHPSEAELSRLTDEFVRAAKRREGVPAFLIRLFYRIVLARSVLARGIAGASGTFLSGMNTYLMKLGPDNLPAFVAPIDRKIAASLPVVGRRLRLQDVAELLAEGLVSALAARPGRPCHLLNIGGGSAIDSLNALLVLRRDHGDLLSGRSIRIHVLDIDTAGPAFGARALAALLDREAPLHGLDVRFERVPYDWAERGRLPATLAGLVPPDAVVAASSEGALFEYASDDLVIANLEALRISTPPGTAVAGSVTRDDGPAKYVNASSGVRLHPRSLDAFRSLARRAGWAVARVIERPFSRNVSLRKAP